MNHTVQDRTQRGHRRVDGPALPRPGGPSLATPGLALAGSLLYACAASSAPIDPQQPIPRGRTDAPSRIVICPEGSSYDPSRNVCVATAVTRPAGGATGGASTATGEAQADIAVACSFTNGWAAVLPVDQYPDDDSFLMQALIGMTEDPDFWANESDYGPLRPYAAKPCSQQAQHFRVPPGAYYVLAGETGTYNRRGTYTRNGYKSRVQVSRSSPVSVSISRSDLTHTWECISCPFVAFLDPWSGRWLPAFVILAHRNAPTKRGTDHYAIENVPVRDGRLRLRIVEAEREVSRIDQLVVEVGGHRQLPRQGGVRSALAAVDGTDVELHRGRQVEVDYDVPGVVNGTVSVRVVAHGHYEPAGQ